MILNRGMGSWMEEHTKVPEEDAGVVFCRWNIGEERAWEVDMAAVGLDAGRGLAEAVGGFVRYRGPWVVLGGGRL